MRVAHILRKYDPSEWGGTETAIERLAAGLAVRGVESVVCAPRLAQASRPADPLAAAGCVVRRFRAFVPVWGLSAEKKRQMVAVGGNLLSFELMALLWREAGLDVIHSHALGRLGAMGRAVARGRRLPFVLSIHGGAYDLPLPVRRSLNRLAAGGWDWGRPLGLLLRARRLIGDADAIVTCNPREAELIRGRHPGLRVFVQPHGVPLAVFSRDQRAAAREAFPVLRDRAVLLQPGRIDPVKNQDWLVAQAAELARRHPQILLVLAGACTNREYGEALQARIDVGGLRGHVLLAGALPPGDARLIGLFQEAQAVILPSVSETFGLVILESWAAATPVISSRTSGATALVRDGVNGFLFDLDRPAAFHAAVDQILTQPGKRRQWGAAGLATVAAEFDSAQLAGRMRLIYENLIGEKNAHRHPARR
jgi:glycosyltransferase involved in cell wall biosynthesis